MTSTNLNIRVDKDVKEKADLLFQKLGMNMTTAVNIFLRTAIRESGIPFEVKLDKLVAKPPEDLTRDELSRTLSDTCIQVSKNQVLDGDEIYREFEKMDEL